MRRDLLYLQDIVEATSAIGRFLTGITEAEFMADELRQSAVLQKLMIIGEAAARVTPELKASSPDVPWTSIVGFRNVAVHAYFNVDWSIVWTAATEDAPDLQARVQIIIDSFATSDV